MSHDNYLKKVDSNIVEDAMLYFLYNKGGTVPSEIIRYVESQGFIYGEPKELEQFAKVQLTRQYIGRLRDTNGKRKYVSTRQVSLDFDENIYCQAEQVIKGEEETKHSLAWLHKHLMGLIRRCPLLPDWAISRIITVINDVFEELKRIA